MDEVDFHEASTDDRKESKKEECQLPLIRRTPGLSCSRKHDEKENTKRRGKPRPFLDRHAGSKARASRA